MIKLVFPGAAMEAPKCCNEACNCSASCNTVGQTSNGEAYNYNFTMSWTSYEDIW